MVAWLRECVSACVRSCLDVCVCFFVCVPACACLCLVLLVFCCIWCLLSLTVCLCVAFLLFLQARISKSLALERKEADSMTSPTLPASTEACLHLLSLPHSLTRSLAGSPLTYSLNTPHHSLLKEERASNADVDAHFWVPQPRIHGRPFVCLLLDCTRELLWRLRWVVCLPQLFWYIPYFVNSLFATGVAV